MAEKAATQTNTPLSQLSTVVTESPESPTHNPRIIHVKTETPAKSRERVSFKSFLSDSSSVLTLRLENSGSVARDHLALERTFLAYVRTSLTVASAGVVLVQLFSVSGKTSSASGGLSQAQRHGHALGATIIGFGIAVLLFGCTRFFSVQFALVKGKFPVARLVVGSISVALAVLVSIIFGLLIAARH